MIECWLNEIKMILHVWCTVSHQRFFRLDFCSVMNFSRSRILKPSYLTGWKLNFRNVNFSMKRKTEPIMLTCFFFRFQYINISIKKTEPNKHVSLSHAFFTRRQDEQINRLLLIIHHWHNGNVVVVQLYDWFMHANLRVN